MTYAPLRKHLAQLKTLAGQLQPPEPSTQSHTHAKDLAYLVKPIQAWLQSMSPRELQRNFTVEEVIRLADLRGKTSQAPSTRDVGQALRKVGFSAARDWTLRGRNRRAWRFIDEAAQLRNTTPKKGNSNV